MQNLSIIIQEDSDKRKTENLFIYELTNSFIFPIHYFNQHLVVYVESKEMK